MHLVFCDQHKCVRFNLIKLIVDQMCAAACINPNYRLIIVPVRLKWFCVIGFYELIIDAINVEFIAPVILFRMGNLLLFAHLFSINSVSQVTLSKGPFES